MRGIKTPQSEGIAPSAAARSAGNPPDPQRPGSNRRNGGKFVLAFVAPLVVLLALTAFFRTGTWDLVICRALFVDSGTTDWLYDEVPFWHWLYRFGPIPGLVLGIGGGAVALLSYSVPPLKRFRRMGFFLIALLALGPGLTVNGIIKPEWQRPRPKQVTALGGSHSYVEAWDFGPRGAGQSFPSGHASMGFFLMAPAFLLYRRHRRWAYAFFLFGTGSGVLLGIGRIAQGQHFPSDVIWAAGLIYLWGVVLSYIFETFYPVQERLAAGDDADGSFARPGNCSPDQRRAA